jgi:hopanoid C-2 methylase
MPPPPPADSPRKQRVLIINCYFPETRAPDRLVNEIPNSLAPVFLAAAFEDSLCEIKLYNEVTDGFMELYHPRWLRWPDLVVFTGLAAALDRMRILYAYLKTNNPKVITVAGGFAVQALPRYAKQLFDYACLGDAEELRDVVRDALGAEYVAREPRPRYDLAHWLHGAASYVESTRNCNFRCDFCSLTANGAPYEAKSLDFLRAQLEAHRGTRLLLFSDNQFHASDQRFFEDRVQLLKDMRRRGHFQYWTAFVTDAFFWSDKNVKLAQESGCIMLFVGVESFDQEWLNAVNKPQNCRHSQVELIRTCMDAGVLFQYGLVYDPSQRAAAAMQHELAYICSEALVPLPNYIFMATPMPGTPFFADRARRGLILPRTRLRDLEGSTLTLQPVDDMDHATTYARGVKKMRGLRLRALTHQLKHLLRYRHSLSPLQALASSATLMSTLVPHALSLPHNLFVERRRRTHVSTTEVQDVCYTPRAQVASRFAALFQPTLVTLADGSLNEALADDLLDTRYRGARRIAKTREQLPQLHDAGGQSDGKYLPGAT